jgi:hypothetical protein
VALLSDFRLFRRSSPFRACERAYAFLRCANVDSRLSVADQGKVAQIRAHTHGSARSEKRAFCEFCHAFRPLTLALRPVYLGAARTGGLGKFRLVEIETKFFDTAGIRGDPRRTDSAAASVSPAGPG